MRLFSASLLALASPFAAAVTWHGTNVTLQLQRTTAPGGSPASTLEIFWACDLYGTVGGGGGMYISLTDLWGTCTNHLAPAPLGNPLPVLYTMFPTRLRLTYLDGATLRTREDNRCITVGQSLTGTDITTLRYDCSDTLFMASFDL